MKSFALMIMLSAVISASYDWAGATTMYFVPDTAYADLGDTVTFTAHITASDTVRGFTVYMVYDTNIVDLVGAPTPGSLIAGLPGLDFRYADHIVAAPAWLEVGATVFGTTYWAGPGALFQFSLVMRECGVVPMTGSFSMRRPNGNFIPGTFSPPAILVCDAVPLAPDSLTIFWTGTAAYLRWKAVTENEFGFPLADPPTYVVYRAEELPAFSPFAPIDTVNTLEYVDSTGLGEEHLYYVRALIE